MSIIKLDYDGKTLYTFNKRIWIIPYLGITCSRVEKCRTQHGGWHVRITVEEKLKALEIMAIQSLLGSDYRRETYNLFRIMMGMRNWNALFRGTEK